MDLSKISDDELIVRLDRLVRSERKITHLILCHINEVESRNLHAAMGFGSMYRFLTQHYGYCEDGAYSRIRAAKLLLKNPEIAEKLEEGTLNLTQLNQVQKCLRQEQKMGHAVAPSHVAQILEQIEGQTNYQTKKTLAVEFNQPIQMHETVKPQRDDSVRLEITMTEEQMKLLADAKDLLSHVLPHATWADVIAHLAQKHIEKKLGKKNEGSTTLAADNNVISNNTKFNTGSANEAKIILQEEPRISTQSFAAKPKRVHIRITDRRKLLTAADCCCEFVDLKTNNKCGSTYQLQVDHIIPLALGGTDSVSNLRILCRTHNLLSADQCGLVRK